MYENFGTRELLNLVRTLESELIKANVELGMTRGDAQAVVEAVISKAN